MKPVVIGVSAGGPKTLRALLREVRDLKVPIVIAQHNLSSQMEDFSRWLRDETGKDVILVERAEVIQPGFVYLPAGNKDIMLRGEDIVVVEESKGLIAPSIDRLFESAARYLEGDAIAVVLGGLGEDGVKGAMEVARVGGRVIVQSDAEFSYLPEAVARRVDRVARRTLKEIALMIESMGG